MVPERASRTKNRLLLRWWAVQTAVLYPAVAASDWLEGGAHWDSARYAEQLVDPDYLVSWLVLAPVFALLQWLFLLPVCAPTRARRGVRLWGSMAVGGLLITTILTGAAILFVGALKDVAHVRPRLLGSEDYGGIALALVGTNWIVATPLLVAFTRRSGAPEGLHRRLSAILFAGSAVEVIAAVPLDALAARSNNCTCGRGTYHAIVLGTAAGTVLLGPFVILTLLARRHRRWPEGRCAACGRSVGEIRTILRCPHCGSGFRER